MEKTDNELIAEFMGKEITGVQANFGERIKVFVLPDKPLSERKTGRSIEAKYDTSWDWLMPVVEKISKIVTPENEVILNGDESRFDSFYPRTFGMLNAETKQFMVRINRFPLYQSDSLIEATYEAVVEFIKWYNQTITP